MKRRILVSSALPYANGPIHLGHITEVVQTDVWVRALAMQGHEINYVCAEDSHGTPVMLRAEREGIEPVDLIERMATEHAESYRNFGIGMANFYTTHSEENREFSELIYSRLKEKGHPYLSRARKADSTNGGMARRWSMGCGGERMA